MKKTLFFIFVLFMVSICLVPIGREAYQEVAMPTAEALVCGAEGGLDPGSEYGEYSPYKDYYDNYMQAYFSGLTNNMGSNVLGSCGYVALGMALSYYDSYLNDNIIPERYDVPSKGYQTNMVERGDSPGIFNDSELYKYEGDPYAYYKEAKKMKNISLHAKLLTIGGRLNILSEYRGEEMCHANMKQLRDILTSYLNEYNITGWNISSIGVDEVATYSQIEDFIRKNIDDGYPVIVSVKSDSKEVGHVVVCHENSENDFIANLGYIGDTPAKTRAYIKKRYDHINDAMVLKFDNMEHTHSNNYEVNGAKYCYCNSNIMTYTGDMSKFDESNSFSGNLVIPKWVTSIGDDVFNNNPNIKTVSFEEGSKIQSIGDRAFYGCNNLWHVTLPPSLKTIGASAFEKCADFGYLDIEQNSQLETIGDNAFSGTCIDGVNFPASLKSIGAGAFSDMKKLSGVVIPSTVTEIKANAFTYDSSIDSNGITVYTECASKPADWDANWTSCPVFWSCTLSDDKTYVKSFYNAGQNAITNAANGVVSPWRMYYSFDGWYLNEACSGSSFTTEQIASSRDNRRYYPKWINASYNIIYKDGDGSDFSGVHQPNYSTTYTNAGGVILDIPTQDRYKFVTWILNGAFVTSIPKNNWRWDITLYARWVPTVFAILYYDVGHEPFSGVHGGYYPTEYVAGVGAVLDTPTKDGAEFIGWFYDKKGKNEPVTEISQTKKGNVLLYARWSDSPAFPEFEVDNKVFNMGFYAPEYDWYYTDIVYKTGNIDDYSYMLREALFPAVTRLNQDASQYELNTDLISSIVFAEEDGEYYAHVSLFENLVFSDGEPLYAENFKAYFELSQTLAQYPNEFIASVEVGDSYWDLVVKFQSTLIQETAYSVLGELRALSSYVSGNTYSSLNDLNYACFSEMFPSYGKYRFENAYENTITLVKNENYSVKSKLEIESLNISFYDDYPQARSLFGEELDVIYSVPNTQIEESGIDAEYYAEHSFVRMYLSIGKNSQLMQNPDRKTILQALGYAIDYDALYTLWGNTAEQNGWFPDYCSDGVGGTMGSSMTYPWANTQYGGQGYGYAVLLLNSIGYYDGFNLSMYLPNSEDCIVFATFLQECFSYIDITLTFHIGGGEEVKQSCDLCLGMFDFSGGFVCGIEQFLDDNANWLILNEDDTAYITLQETVEQLMFETDPTTRLSLLQTLHDLLIEQGVKIGYVNHCFLIKSQYASMAPKLFQLVCY